MVESKLEGNAKDRLTEIVKERHLFCRPKWGSRAMRNDNDAHAQGRFYFCLPVEYGGCGAQLSVGALQCHAASDTH